ncbi:MAG: alpha-glucosidase [Candidatus Solibacter sp.]|nr:alpha-glucosidase [Candidatus Solibacter sp.]
MHPAIFARSILAAALCLAAAAEPRREVAVSPDELVQVTVCIDGERITYSAVLGGKPAVLESPLALDGWPAGKFISSSRKLVLGTWRPLYGERAVIPDNFLELTLSFDRLTIVVRVYEEGFAFRYRLEGKGSFEFAGEATGFRFPDGSYAWQQHGAEGEYERVPVKDLKPGCERPLTVELGGGNWAALAEAGQVDYPRMLLGPDGAGGLTPALDGPVRGSLPFETPWRVLVLGRAPGDLMERNYLLLNLNPPPVGDYRWVKPGKVLREVTLSTKGGKAAVDFAVKRGIDFIEYDAGWYGHEYDDSSDASQVSPDPKRIAAIPDHGGLDLHEVIRYARSNNIGVLLYVNRRALERQRDLIFPLFRKWGVAGVKFGFVQVDGQRWPRWLVESVRKAADHKLVVDIHDSFRPSGWQRTHPNLLTAEGVRGNEHMPTASHNATLPFTRAIAGAYDYTICWTTPRLKTTRAHQMAMSVVVYSPLQFLFWYDRPDQVEHAPELDFFYHLPVTWDETRSLAGAVGEHAVIARRSGQSWYLGAITNERSRTVELRMGMLAPGAPYTLKTWCDGDSKTSVVIREAAIKGGDPLTLGLAASGGCAALIEPR